jgi:hypothetical protein
MNNFLRAALIAPVLIGVGAAAIPAAQASAQAGPAAVKKIGSCRSHGDFATCVTGKPGSVNHPKSIHVHVSATPGAHVTGAWSMTCSKGLGAASSHGKFSGHTTLTRKLHFPMSHPDQCFVSADAQRDGSGGIHVWLTART